MGLCMEKTDILQPDFSTNDFFDKLCTKYKLKPFTIIGVVFLINLIVNFSFAIGFDGFNGFSVSYNGENWYSCGFLSEPGAWIIDFFAQPMIIGFYCWLLHAPTKLFLSLISEKRLNLSEEVIDILYSTPVWARKKWVKYTAFVLSILIQASIIAMEIGIFGGLDKTQVTWNLVHPSVMIARTIIAIPVYYSLIMILVIIILVVLSLSRIFQIPDSVVIDPYDADNAAGLSVIGKFMTNLGVLDFVFAMVIGGFYWQSSVINGKNYWLGVSLVTLILYSIASIALLYIPLFSTHSMMKEKRNARISELKKRMAIEIDKLASISYEDDSKVILQRIEALRNLKDEAQKMPLWPVNLEIKKKYYTLVLSPVVTLLITEVGGHLIEKLLV